jgi:release factor glutamine methyltransferase
MSVLGVSEPKESARYLLCKAANIGYQYSHFHSKFDNILSEDQMKTFISDCKRRLTGEPIQYIIGDWDFYGLTIKCKSPVLIPRPETEELVDHVIKSLKLQKLCKPFKILDIGCGSGVIGLALLSKFPLSNCIGLDISNDAVQLANDNAELILGDSARTRYISVQQSFLDHVKDSDNHGKYDIIVSNPPYIPSDDIPELQPEVRLFEDIQALDGGMDGMNMIRDIIEHSDVLLHPQGTKELWMEVDPSHPDRISQWIERERGKSIQFDYIQGIKDLSGLFRFVRFRIRSN